MRIIFPVVVMVMLLLVVNYTQAGVSLIRIRNGGFENDGRPIDPVTEYDAPECWSDVNVPGDKFGAKVNTEEWPAPGYGDGNSLTIYSRAFEDLFDGDTAMLSQQVYLRDANVIFNIALTGTHSNYQWESEKFSAVLLIDEIPVWDSRQQGVPDGDGVYIFEVNSVDIANSIDINDANLYTVSLAMRANKDGYYFTQYQVRWDFVKFDAHCGGFGYWAGDLNQDCYVNFIDFGILAAEWLEEPNSACIYDLVEDGMIDEYDLMYFAGTWLDCSNWQDANCVEVGLLDADFSDDGTVDESDIAVLADYWLTAGASVNCACSVDINEDGVVNLIDFAIMAQEWKLKSWLYGLE